MARFSGEIGYATAIEISPGTWDEVITEKKYCGDVTRVAKRDSEGVSVNDSISVMHSISVVADELTKNFLAIRYIRWMGVLWKVREVEVQHPRLVMRLGDVYNGPVGTPESS